MEVIILQNNYVEELKNGKQIRIKYNRLIHDWVEDDSGWMEELWCYDDKLDLFKCYYPTSTYEKDFYTTHTEEQTKSFMEGLLEILIMNAKMLMY